MKNNNTKRAIILAGGKGTRLRPYTVVLPKPLMPIGEFPILEVVIIQLAKYGFKHITLAVNHQADIFKAFFMDGAKWGVLIDYVLEEKELGTMGALSLIRESLPENFLVLNGDVLTDLDFANFYNLHCLSDSFVSISSYNRKQKIDFGVLKSDTNATLIGFEEKPNFNFEVSMGVYCINFKALESIPHNVFFGFDNLMLSLLNNNNKVSLINHKGYWLDIGRPDDYMEAIEIFESKKDIFLPI
jgi:NDP-sugar pyrophosphorylase family protein